MKGSVHLGLVLGAPEVSCRSLRGPRAVTGEGGSQCDLMFSASVSIKEVQFSLLHIFGVSPNDFTVVCQKMFEDHRSCSTSSFTDKIVALQIHP